MSGFEDATVIELAKDLIPCKVARKLGMTTNQVREILDRHCVTPKDGRLTEEYRKNMEGNKRACKNKVPS